MAGHGAGHITDDIVAVVHTAAVRADASELVAARRRGIPVFRRGEVLPALLAQRISIAVSGTHGKTTTSTFITRVLHSAGVDPAWCIGGEIEALGGVAGYGAGPIVVEADESDGSFLEFNPWVSIITNIDCEHLDYYGSIENLRGSFLEFIQNTRDKVIGWGDQPYLAELISKAGGLSFGWEKGNLLRGANFKFDQGFSCFDLYIKGEFISSVKTPLIGKHNCLNTLAALAFFYHLGEDLERVKEALLDFKGTRRRMEAKGTIKGVTFIDDYAHHPAEIKAVLSAAKLLNPKRLFVIFQPHRFSRVSSLKDEFARCFSGADHLVISDIYSASEENTFGVSAQALVEQVSNDGSGQVEYIPKNKLATDIPSYLKKGDLVLGLGAGDINSIMEEIRKCL